MIKQIILLLIITAYSTLTYAFNNSELIALIVKWQVIIIISLFIIFLLLPKKYQAILLGIILALFMIYFMYIAMKGLIAL